MVKNKKKIGFSDIPADKSSLEKFLERYVVFSVPSTNIGGFFCSLKKDGRNYYMLNPYQKIIFESGLPRMILFKDKKGKLVEESQILSVEPSTKRAILDYCDYWTRVEQAKYLNTSRGIIVVSPAQASEFLKDKKTFF